MYDEDKQVFLKDKNAFESLICALSAYYYKKKEVEKIPQSFLPRERMFSLPEKA